MTLEEILHEVMDKLADELPKRSSVKFEMHSNFSISCEPIEEQVMELFWAVFEIVDNMPDAIKHEVQFVTDTVDGRWYALFEAYDDSVIHNLDGTTTPVSRSPHDVIRDALLKQVLGE